MNTDSEFIFDIESFIPKEEGYLLEVALKLEDYIRFSLDKSLWDFIYVDDVETARSSQNKIIYDVEDVSEHHEEKRMQQWMKEDPNTEILIRGGLVFKRGNPFQRLPYSYPELAVAWMSREEYRRIQREREQLDLNLPASKSSSSINSKTGLRI